MPAAPPVAFATLASPLQPPNYILGITPTSLSGRLVLQHPSPDLTLCDNQTLAAVDTLRGQHTAPITGVRCDAGSIWTSGKDARIVRWDERAQRAATTITAEVRKPIPVTALEISDSDHLVIGGTELVSSEAHILFWDMRNPKTPAYRHSSTHSDDITVLSLLPPTRTYASHPERKLPPRLLLSASTDGCIALSDPRETDEDEAVQAQENWNESIAAAGTYEHKGRLRVWARSDMDNLATWTVGTSEADENGDVALELQDLTEAPSDQFKFREFNLPSMGPNVVHPAMTEKPYPTQIKSEYLIDACPSLGVGRGGAPMVAVGTNEGNIVLEHGAFTSSGAEYSPSAYFMSGPAARGHKDVVRCLYHATRDEALYTGSEDGVLAGWSLASLPRLRVGDPEIDDDGGDGREDIDSDDESEESEIVTEESDQSDSSGMDVDEPKGYNPVIGTRRGGDRVEKRKGKRHAPY